jgi:hypothetical protein
MWGGVHTLLGTEAVRRQSQSAEIYMALTNLVTRAPIVIFDAAPAVLHHAAGSDIAPNAQVC